MERNRFVVPEVNEIEQVDVLSIYFIVASVMERYYGSMKKEERFILCKYIIILLLRVHETYTKMPDTLLAVKDYLNWMCSLSPFSLLNCNLHAMNSNYKTIYFISHDYLSYEDIAFKILDSSIKEDGNFIKVMDSEMIRKIYSNIIHKYDPDNKIYPKEEI